MPRETEGESYWAILDAQRSGSSDVVAVQFLVATLRSSGAILERYRPSFSLPLVHVLGQREVECHLTKVFCEVTCRRESRAVKDGAGQVRLGRIKGSRVAIRGRGDNLEVKGPSLADRKSVV